MDSHQRRTQPATLQRGVKLKIPDNWTGFALTRRSHAKINAYTTTHVKLRLFTAKERALQSVPLYPLASSQNS